VNLEDVMLSEILRLYEVPRAVVCRDRKQRVDWQGLGEDSVGEPLAGVRFELMRKFWRWMVVMVG
jgi:hypothetical protein